MIVDLDQWLVAEQEHVAKERVFAHDVFISHRRFDSPAALVETLAAYGAQVVWDCDLDLRDRRVVQGVAHAMRRSRFIALYVSDQFIDSPWCRAEYLNARWIEEKYKIPRALVICESNAAITRIPAPLKGVRQFALGEGGDRDLAEFILSGNSVESETARKLLACPKERLAHDVCLLSLDEQLNLLEQRTLFWFEQGDAKISLSKTERRAVGLSHLMLDSISEVEKIFREVCMIVFESRGSDRLHCGIHEAELKRVITMAKAVVDGYSHPTREKELRGLDKWAYDFVLKPLLLAVELQETRSGAARVYRDLCLALLRGEYAREVPVYLSVIEAVEAGQETKS